MNTNFLSENFLLQTETAKLLFHDYAKKMPIIDYHNHLPPEEIAQDKSFDNITSIWLNGDHYKWRAMRTMGVDEHYITGAATDKEKFLQWAKVVPYTMRNPLYHWTHMELAHPFGIKSLLNESTAEKIYEQTSEMLRSKEFSVKNILKKFNVQMVGTTDDPIDSLSSHKKIVSDNFDIKVLPSFRPDKGMTIEDSQSFNNWVDQLAIVCDKEIIDFNSYLEAIKIRHDYFAENGCRISDHGLETIYADDYTEDEVQLIFSKARRSEFITEEELKKFKSCMLYNYALLDHSKSWVQQFHIGALRNNNERMHRELGPDKGFDSIGDFTIGRSMAKFLAQKMAATIPQLDYDIIGFVPSVGKSQRKRGYNQAEMLAEELAKLYNLPKKKLLLRTNHTDQIGLNRSERLLSVQNNFISRSNCYGKTILLVDDVITTGATLSECSNTLKQAGAKRVWGIAIAKK